MSRESAVNQSLQELRTDGRTWTLREERRLECLVHRMKGQSCALRARLDGDESPCPGAPYR
jgi:hypothetical protein